MGRFGLGQPVLRAEDPRLLTGRGRYTADIDLPGQAHAVYLRSPHAHAAIDGIDIDNARAAPGVQAVYTGADTAAAGLGEIPCLISVKDAGGRRLPRPGRPLLARDRVRFVGDTVAMVVAETREQAVAASERIDVRYRPLPVVATMEDALADSAPLLWDGAPGNVAFHWSLGDAGAVEPAFETANRIARVTLVNNRVVPCPMEPRAVVADFDATSGRYTLHTSSQGAHLIRDLLAGHTLKAPADSIRVIVPDVGGAFGAKIFHYAEEALGLWAARQLRRPIKWIGERLEAFTCDTHGRDQQNIAEAAIDADGRVLALRVDTIANMGAYLNCFAPAIPSDMTGRMLTGAYDIPLLFATCRGIYTNTVPVDAYRGAGRPEASYLIERLMEEVGRVTGLPSDEARRRNLVPAARMPYRAATGRVYDTGDFDRNMTDAMATAAWTGAAERRREAAERGRLLGIGMSVYVEACGTNGEEEAAVRVGDDGSVEVLIGTQSAGQGHETAYAQIVADALGVPFDAVRVVQGDTDLIPFGNGTGGSRSLPTGGPVVRTAADEVIAHGTVLAARLLQADAADVSFADGRYRVVDDDRTIDLPAVARAAAEEDTAGLSATARYGLNAATYPNGCHVAEVEIDPETGATQVVRYVVVDDFGVVVNPLLLAGQIHGGVAQGLGQALMERAIYDRDSAQLVTASFLDYALPRAADMPPMEIAYNNIPCAANPMGIKGAGEAGAIAACPAVINAVLDALAPLGVRHVDMPATPETIWRTIQAANQAAGR